MSRGGFAGAALSLVAVFAASASPIPLYELYRRADGVSHTDLSLTAVAYFICVMVALVVLGRLSDHLGRRPVALAALAITAAGTLVLTQVHGAELLFAGRALQGLGCGLASSALAAYVVDSAPVGMGGTIAAVSPMFGLTAGAVVSGVLAQYGSAPRTLAYLLAAGLLGICAVLVLCGRETVARTGDAARSLRPRVHMPVSVRGLLPATATTFVATWSLGGFFQAFGPSVAAEQLRTSSTVVAAVLFAAFMAPSVVGAPLAARVDPLAAQRYGIVVFATAVVALVLSLKAGAVGPLLVATAIAGAAQGTTFAAGMSGLLGASEPSDRAGVLSVVYLISYAGAALPSLVAGQLARSLTLLQIALGYAALAVIACAATLVAARRVPSLV